MDNIYYKILYKLALKAFKKNEVPVSAIIVLNGKIIAKAYNKKNLLHNSLLHAEIICLQKAFKKLKRWNLFDCDMYVNLEPCDMCKYLIEESRINKVNFLLKKGICNNKYNKTKYEQMFDADATVFSELLVDFFKKLRN